MNQNSENIITVKNLSKSYKDITAVDDITFEVKRGKLFAFLGVNGAGKSTTINILTSIIKKDSGEIYIDGYNLDKHPSKVKELIGIVFQSSVLDGQLTVLQNLRSRASLYGLSRKYIKERIEYLTEVFDLSDILKRNYNTLSGGQRRRVDIARALLNEPKILFLDEPTTGLDPNTRISVWKIVENLIDEHGLTVFLTTHYMEEVIRADKVIIIDKGKIVASGSPDELKKEYTTDFVRVITQKNDEIESLFDSEKIIYTYKNNSYYVKSKDADASLAFIKNHRNFITDFEILKGDMDDVFLNVTGKKLEG